MAHGNVAPSYPEYLELRYPKVGTTNPTVTFHLLDVENLSTGPVKLDIPAFTPEDLIIGEVAWVTDDNKNVIYRTFNRVQDQEKLVLVDTAAKSSTVVRERNASPGWIDNNIAIQYVGDGSYIDLSDESGYMHIYSFKVDGAEGSPVTSGDWEVKSILNVNTRTKRVYYLSTERDSTERHVYSVTLSGANKTPLVDVSAPGYWAASFSSKGGYYILTYNGPGLPNQKLYSTNSTAPIRTINDNAVLKAKLADYTLPNVTWGTIDHPDGYSFNYMETKPVNFDPSKKYPIVFDIYGGPDSQQTGKTFRQVDFRSYLASDPELEYIVLAVDNRGTCCKGKAYRTLVAGHLGEFEAEDQVYAAKEWAKKSYVDGSKIAIMGWSYGGYLSAKVLETNSDAFSLGLVRDQQSALSIRH